MVQDIHNFVLFILLQNSQCSSQLCLFFNFATRLLCFNSGHVVAHQDNIPQLTIFFILVRSDWQMFWFWKKKSFVKRSCYLKGWSFGDKSQFLKVFSSFLAKTHSQTFECFFFSWHPSLFWVIKDRYPTSDLWKIK